MTAQQQNSIQIQGVPETAPAPPADARDAEVEAFLSEVRAELIRARSKFPGDRIMTIALAEEFGELCKAVLDESAARVRKEAVQTAVMAARVVLDGDGSVSDWRREKDLDPLVADRAMGGESITHGVNCEKAPHYSGGGYLHTYEDDGPYYVDGARYCGRCHYAMGAGGES